MQGLVESSHVTEPFAAERKRLSLLQKIRRLRRDRRTDCFVKLRSAKQSRAADDIIFAASRRIPETVRA
jgi:hypothetical protein